MIGTGGVAAPMGALQQAIGLQQGAQQAATSTVEADPLMDQANAELAKTAAAKQAASDTVSANIQQQQALLSQPLPSVPAAPAFKELPDAPPPQPAHDPLKVFGQFMPVLAALGALTTRRPAIDSLNAATAAINASKTNDKEALEKAHTDWLDNMKLAMEQNDLLSKQYSAALSNRKATMDERMAQVERLASLNGDAVTLSQLQSGNADGIFKLMDVRDKASTQIGDMVKHVDTMNQQRAELAERTSSDAQGHAIGWANANKPTMGGIMGGILQKTASGIPLAPGEQAALKQYQQISHPNDSGGVLGQLLAAGGKTPPPAGAVAAGGAGAGAPTSNAGPGAVATGLPPAAQAQLQEGVKTTFQNGQTWMLQNGTPVKVK